MAIYHKLLNSIDMEKLKILNLNFSFQRAAHYHINGGMLLMGVVLLAMFLANSPWGDIYASFWNYEVHLQIGEFNFFSHNGHHMTLMTFINDALMAVFFFSVGLEIKREILVGELSSFRQALLPIVAACGGMLVPVLIYYFMTAGTPAQSGLAIPMATDIAFSLGVLSLFGKRVPLSLKVFLTAFAVVDDIGGILVITNFLGNAKKFTSQGHIKLGYFCDKEKKEIHIFVEDTGAGIPKEELQMIFERFYKRNEFVQGVGLGLAISKVIVEKMNGHIDVQSEVNKGSRFTAVLPYL
jgi:signal transduction histidine kinase